MMGSLSLEEVHQNGEMFSDTALLIRTSAQSPPVKDTEGILETSHMSNYLPVSLSSEHTNI